MKVSFVLSVLLSVVFAVNFSPSVQSTSSSGWTYVPPCPTCPENWGKSHPMCLPKNNMDQSPIDIVTSATSKGGECAMGKIMSTKEAKYEVVPVTSGYHFECKTKDTCGSLTLDSKKYFLKEFHFHTHSEHTINGKSLPFEVHMVHKTKNDEVAVASVLLKTGSKSVDLSTPLNAIMDEETEIMFDLGKVMSKGSGYYRYKGGFTTPPCTGNVQWIVQSYHKSMLASQVTQFLSMIGTNGRGNWRPVQPLSTRKVTRYFPSDD